MENIKLMSVDVKGEKTGDTYRGEFTFLLLLTPRQDAFADQVRRALIGPSPEGTVPLPQTQTDAYILGQLAARVVEAPRWWKDSDSGRDLLDPNVVLEVYNKSLEATESLNKVMAKKAGDAAKKLKEKKKTDVIVDTDDE